MGYLETGLFALGYQTSIGVVAASVGEGSHKSGELVPRQVGESRARVYENAVVAAVLALGLKHL